MNELVGYLSQIIIDDVTAIKSKLITPYQWHKTIWLFFSEKEKRDFLFNIDASKTPIQGLILSRTLPQGHPYIKINTKPLYRSYFSASHYQFELSCNPTQKKRVMLEDGTRKKNGSRLGIVNAEQAEEWLRNKGKLGGFLIDHLEETSFDLITFEKEPHRLTLASVCFKGTLKITDQEQFVETLFNGVGSAKGLGFGLFKIIPIKE